MSVMFGFNSGIDCAYLRLYVGDCMLRVPCPGLPGAGKWLTWYWKSSDSNAMVEKTAACSPGVVRP